MNVLGKLFKTATIRIVFQAVVRLAATIITDKFANFSLSIDEA